MNAIPLKYVSHITAGQAPPSEVVNELVEGLPFLQGNAEFGSTFPTPRWECDVASKASQPGDILLSVRAPVGALNISDRSYGIGRGLCAISPVSIHSNYLWWWIHSQRPQLEAASTGTTYKAVTTEDVGMLMVPNIALEEQRRIAGFLDAETGKIDAITTKKLKLLSLLDERIDSRILSHVGASLLNPSGNGPVLPIRQILRKTNRPPAKTQEVITAYRDGQVTSRSLRRAEGYTLSGSSEPQGQHVEVDDVVIHGLDGFAGAIGTSEANGNCSPVYHVCTPLESGDPLFLGRLLRVLAITNYLGLFAISTRERAVDFRNWNLFGGIPVPSVPIDEQKDIGRLIKEVRPLRVTIERSNVLAAERRQALITAAVTGQFDVSTASGRGV